MPTETPGRPPGSREAQASGAPESGSARHGPRKIRIRLDPEIVRGTGGKAAPADSPDPSRSLDEYRTARLEAELEELRRESAERKALHGLRTAHAWLLFGLTVAWVVVVWTVVLMQGFGQWFLPHPAPAADEYHLPFKLSDSALIAFMTSTTTTVLGLYGIAAYWMYRGGKPGNDGGRDSGKRDGDKAASSEGAAADG